MIEPLLPPPSKKRRPRSTDLREVFIEIQYMLGTGCQWWAIPLCFPSFTMVQNYSYPWSNNGNLVRMLDALSACAQDHARRSEKTTAAAIDSPSVKTTEGGDPAGHNAVKNINGRKRHLIVDVEGFPIEIVCHDALIQNRDGPPAVIFDMMEMAPHVVNLWAYGGCQGPKLASELEKLGFESILDTVSKPKQTKGFTVLYRRWIVEPKFAWMSRCRRLAKDYECSLEISVAWEQLAACRFMTLRVERGIRP